jgi:hypothetical protein
MTNILDIFSTTNNEKPEIFKKKHTSHYPALNQGKKFKKYQNKIINNLEKNAAALSGKEGFSGLDGNGLTAKTMNVIKNNNYTDQSQIIANLRSEYQNTLQEFENLVASISGEATTYIKRVNPNNPYLNKTVRFTTGHVCYVTNQGVVKWIPNMDIWNSLTIPKTVVEISIPWLDTYFTPGTQIPTNPPLISGTNVQLGQSFGDEGSNIYVNTLVNNPSSSYVGCYNNIPESTDVIFVPTMNGSNSVNGYNSYATSILWEGGAPCYAFDRNPNTYWHSNVNAETNYDSATGEYYGIHYLNYYNGSGKAETAKGEWLQIDLPGINTQNATNIPLTKYDLQGRQDCCGWNGVNGRTPNSWVILGYKDGSWYLVDKRENECPNYALKTFYIIDPKPYQSYIFLITNCGSPNDKSGSRYCVQISQWNLYTSSNYLDNPTPAMTNVGQMNFDQCQQYAVNTGNTYFGLQGLDNNGNGNCMVSNELSLAQRYGEGLIYSAVPLWNSETYGGKGAYCELTTKGSITVYNSSNSPVYNTPDNSGLPSNYMGCYWDWWDRAMPLLNADGTFSTWGGGSKWDNDYQSAYQYALQNGYKYFSNQASYPYNSQGKGQAGFSNDFAQSTKYWTANNCGKVNGFVGGGPWSNAIYSTDGNINSFIVLQDDGNLVLCRGMSPDDNQGVIWSSGTNGKVQSSNTNFAASKGKTGNNWMSSGTKLNPGEFIGSNNGEIYLIMQSDGNLVLYTSSKVSGCSASSSADGKTVGRQNINALYQMNKMGNLSELGKLAYIDGNAELHAYDSSDIQLVNNYTKFDNMNTAYNDIPGAAYGGASVEQCKSSCDSNPNCYGFVMSKQGNVCWPKNSAMYPVGAQQIDPNSTTYVRNKAPINVPIGVPTNVKNTDSVTYQSYINGGTMSNEYGLAKATSVQKQQLDQLQTRLNLLSDQITSYTTKFGNGSTSADNQAAQNVTGINDYLTDIKQTDKDIVKVSGESNGNIQNILKDSDIVVLQKNYNYLFWSILATGTVLISMNIVKK